MLNPHSIVSDDVDLVVNNPREAVAQCNTVETSTGTMLLRRRWGFVK